MVCRPLFCGALCRYKSAAKSHLASSTLQIDPVCFLDGKVDEALQNALSLQDQPEMFREVILQLRKNADEAFSVIPPIWPQKKALRNFVTKSMVSFPIFFGSCRRDTTLLHHLQRYAACYLAYKTGYFERLNSTRQATVERNQHASFGEPAFQPQSHTPARVVESEHAFAAIKAFLAGCHPPMSHLLEEFKRVRITGEMHLHALASQNEVKIREYLGKIATTPLELETLVQALENLRRNREI